MISYFERLNRYLDKQNSGHTHKSNMTSLDFSSIPIIDLSLADDAESKPKLLKDLRYALTSVGFLYVSNHGVSDVTIKNLREALPKLFGLSEKEKETVALENSPHFLGYSGEGKETTAGEVDRREQFEFATELEDDWVEGRALADRLKGPNQVSL